MSTIPSHTAAVSDQLHRLLATSISPGVCWLLVDPSPFFVAPMRGSEWLNEIIANPNSVQVQQSRTDLPAEMYPFLLRFDTNQMVGSQQLCQSIGACLEENQAEKLLKGHGRAISGWLECDVNVGEDAKLLRDHLSQLMFHRRPDGRIEWLRWYDPTVLWSLWEILTPEQRNTLLGPIHCLWILDPKGELIRLPPSKNDAELTYRDDATLNRLSLTNEQWIRIDSIGPFNRALAKLLFNARDMQLDATLSSSTLPVLRNQAFSALARAQKHGIHDPQDLMLYAELAMRWHPQFDRHTLVAEALRKYSADNYFSACVADIDELQWSRIRSDLSALNFSPSPRLGV
jgi:Domain of unknown function (DUF4123)